nr:hypothetical protein [Planctomycetota bacterium]
MLMYALLILTQVLGAVTGVSNRVDYDGDDATVAFAFTCPITETSDLDVYVRTIATGVAVAQAETTHYSVSATNNDYSTGGTVTMVAAPASTETLTIVRAMPATQEAEFADSGVLRMTALEGALDKLTMLVQDLTEVVARCPKAPVTDDGPVMVLPNSVDRGDKWLIFDSEGGVALS